MLKVFYEDQDIIVVKKPVGVESQATHSFAPDMVSEIHKHINKLSTEAGESYVGVIHRLDKPVGGIMVYAKTKKAAAALSKQVQEHKMKKTYRAVICGKPVDNVGNFVDYLLKDEKENLSRIVDKGISQSKRAELRYQVVDSLEIDGDILTLVEIELLTGRHHQIRVQFAGHGLPLWGDNRYGVTAQVKVANPNGDVTEHRVEKNRAVEEYRAGRNGRGGERGGSLTRGARRMLQPSVALSSCGLSFVHPTTGEEMSFRMEPEGEMFRRFKRAMQSDASEA